MTQMPASAQHRRITENVLKLVPELPGPRLRLTEEFCLYPDRAMTFPEQLAPYCRLPSGNWFHYLPDTSYAELYRYHTIDAQGHCRRARPFANANHDAAMPAFLHYFDRSSTMLRDGNETEAMKYLGVLLHVLQDACFGVHALEGPGGCDLFFFDRLGISDFSPAAKLAQLDCLDIPDATGKARPLGNSVPEAALRLYSRYCRTVRAARKSCVEILISCRNGENSAPEKRAGMYRNAVRLCADAAATVLHLAQCRRHAPEPFPVTELEPYEPPLGGNGAYRFRSLEENCCYTGSGRQPLAFPEISFRSGLSFGLSVSGQNLLYHLPTGLFRHFSGYLLLTGAPKAQVKCRILNNAAEVQFFELNRNHPLLQLNVPEPSGIFGLHAESDAPDGIMILGDAQFCAGRFAEG